MSVLKRRPSYIEVISIEILRRDIEKCSSNRGARLMGCPYEEFLLLYKVLYREINLKRSCSISDTCLKRPELSDTKCTFSGKSPINITIADTLKSGSS